MAKRRSVARLAGAGGAGNLRQSRSLRETVPERTQRLVVAPGQQLERLRLSAREKTDFADLKKEAPQWEDVIAESGPAHRAAVATGDAKEEQYHRLMLSVAHSNLNILADYQRRTDEYKAWRKARMAEGKAKAKAERDARRERGEPEPPKKTRAARAPKEPLSEEARRNLEILAGNARAKNNVRSEAAPVSLGQPRGTKATGAEAKPTFRTPGNVPATRAQAMRAHTQWNTERYQHEAGMHNARTDMRNATKGSAEYKAAAALYKLHDAGAAATTHAELASLELHGPSAERAAAKYTAAQQAHHEVMQQIAAASAPKVTSTTERATRSAPGKKAAEFGTIESKLRTQQDATDPVEAWQHFGGTQQGLHDALIDEPTGVLEVMARRASQQTGAPFPVLGKANSTQRGQLARYISAQMASVHGATPPKPARSTARAKSAAPKVTSAEPTKAPAAASEKPLTLAAARTERTRLVNEVARLNSALDAAIHAPKTTMSSHNAFNDWQHARTALEKFDTKYPNAATSAASRTSKAS